MNEDNLKIRQLTDIIEKYNVESNMKEKQRYFYDMLFMEKLETMKDDFNLDALQSIVKEYHFVDANRLIFEILPGFKDENINSIAKLLRFILTYTPFESDTKSEYVANAISFANEYYIRLKNLRQNRNINDYINNSIEKNKVGFMYEILQELNLNIPYEDVEYSIEETDEIFQNKDINDLNNIILHHIQSSQMAKLSNLMHHLGINLSFDPEVEKYKSIIDDNEQQK